MTNLVIFVVFMYHSFKGEEKFLHCQQVEFILCSSIPFNTSSMILELLGTTSLIIDCYTYFFELKSPDKFPRGYDMCWCSLTNLLIILDMWMETDTHQAIAAMHYHTLPIYFCVLATQQWLDFLSVFVSLMSTEVHWFDAYYVSLNCCCSNGTLYKSTLQGIFSFTV